MFDLFVNGFGLIHSLAVNGFGVHTLVNGFRRLIGF